MANQFIICFAFFNFFISNLEKRYITCKAYESLITSLEVEKHQELCCRHINFSFLKGKELNEHQIRENASSKVSTEFVSVQ